MESVSIREHSRNIEQALSPNLWDTIGVDPLEFLKTKIAPLMRYQEDVKYNEASWTLKVERLTLAILQENELEIERLKNDIGEWLNSLPLTIREVKEKHELLDEVLGQQYWDDVSFDKAQILLNEFTDLMRYKQPEPRPKITLDIDDFVKRRDIIEYGPLPTEEPAITYIEKIEKQIKELAINHPTIKKIKNYEVIDEEDLIVLENTLNSPDLYITEEILQKAYEQPKGTLVQFIKKILGLYEFPDPRERIKEAFKAFIIEKNYLNSDQVNFLRTLQTVFLSKKHIEYKNLLEPPFTNFGVNVPTPLFNEADLNEAIDLCKNLEGELYSVST